MADRVEHAFSNDAEGGWLRRLNNCGYLGAVGLTTGD
jgi:hypothetical protein